MPLPLRLFELQDVVIKDLRAGSFLKQVALSGSEMFLNYDFSGSH